MSQAATMATMHSQTSCRPFSRMVAGMASAAVKKMPAAYPIGIISSMAAIRIRSIMHRKYTKPPKLANQPGLEVVCQEEMEAVSGEEPKGRAEHKAHCAIDKSRVAQPCRPAFFDLRKLNVDRFFGHG